MVNLDGAQDVYVKKYLPRLAYSVTPVEVPGESEVTLCDIDSPNGLIDFISIAVDTTLFEIALEIDGVEIYRLPLAELADSLGLEKGSSLFLGVSADKMTFYDQYPEPIGVQTNFKIKVKNLENKKQDALGFLVRHRVLE